MFADIINKLASAGQDEEKGPYHPRPSIAGPDKCIRALDYHAQGFPAAPFPGRAILTMDDSSWHEELTIDWMRKSTLKCHSFQMVVEIPASGLNPQGYYCGQCEKQVPPNMLHGHIDWIAQDPIGNEYLTEHKALSHFQCQRIEGGWMPWDHIYQACIYSAGLQIVQPGLNNIVLLIKNKNTAQYIEFNMQYDPATDTVDIFNMVISNGNAPPKYVEIEMKRKGIISEAMARFIEVQEYQTAKKLHSRPFPYGTDYPCEYCPWAKTCWDGYIDEIKGMAEEVGLEGKDAELIERYYTTNKEFALIGKARDELNAKVKVVIRNLKAKAVRCGSIVATITESMVSRVNQDKIPPAILEAAREEKLQETLRIKNETDKKKKKEAA